jgi:hypothetical protein
MFKQGTESRKEIWIRTHDLDIGMNNKEEGQQCPELVTLITPIN